jgi:broad specificity phosphatase PhoE
VTTLALLRHAPTDWNTARRLQGRADMPISETSRGELRQRRLPQLVAGFRALSSPLRRCRETATLLRLDPAIDARLIEMDWGSYEGHTLAELKQKFGFDLLANEARGLDFRPPDGESPRDVQARIDPLLAELALAGRPTLAVTHRGVIRAVYARAVGWDMKSDPPHELDLYALHVFRLGPDGAPTLDQMNLPLERP